MTPCKKSVKIGLFLVFKSYSHRITKLAMSCGTCKIKSCEIMELNERHKGDRRIIDNLKEIVGDSEKQFEAEKGRFEAEKGRFEAEKGRFEAEKGRLEEENTKLKENTLSMDAEMVILKEELKRKRLDEENDEEVETKECKVCMNTRPLSSFRTRDNRKNKEGDIAVYWTTRSICHSCKSKKGRAYKKAKVCK